MWQESYLENQVMTADPVQLVRMLYRAAVDALRDARAALAAGKIAERSNAINRALAIIGELSGSLDHSSGGELSRRLSDLYVYVIQGLMDANLRQNDGRLAEIEAILATLGEGWERVDCGASFGPTTAYASSATGQASHWTA